MKALQAGKHVLLEKPVALNAGEVQQMIAARGDRLVGCCSSRHRFLPSAMAAADVVASGRLGQLRSLFCRAIGAAGKAPQSTPPVWRVSRKLNGGGILVNWGCYDLDYLLGIAGWKVKPQLVLAQTWSVPDIFNDRVAPGSDAETHYTALVRCADGIALTMERGEFTTSTSSPVWQIIGDKASLRLNMLPGNGVKVELDEGDPETGITTTVVWEGDESWTCIHEGPIRDFCDAIVNGSKPNTDIENALVVQQITDAIYQSADRGEAVRI
jgi:predicted dehydrogenase